MANYSSAQTALSFIGGSYVTDYWDPCLGELTKK
jgi:hypothetical protein